jgi:hypothetical protein
MPGQQEGNDPALAKQLFTKATHPIQLSAWVDAETIMRKSGLYPLIVKQPRSYLSFV